MLDDVRVQQVTLVPAGGGTLSARMLARALTGRGISAAVSSLDELVAEVPADGVPRLVLLEADGASKQVEQTCRMVREALPQARLVLLFASDNHAQLVARGLADGAVSRTSGLDVLVQAINAAGTGRVARRSRGLVPHQRDDVSRAIASLTTREKEVLRLVATGAPNSEVALRLDISPHTVRTHIQNLLGKLGAENRLAATAMARRAGILPSGPETNSSFAAPVR